MNDVMNLPVIPLRDAILFPGAAAPVSVGRKATLKAVKAAMKNETQKVFVVSQIENTEAVTPDQLHTIGTIASIQHLQHGPRGITLLLDGEQRGIAIRFHERDGFLEATLREVEEMLPLDPTDAAFLAMQREVRERAVELAQRSGLPDEAATNVLESVENAGQLADLVASTLDIAVPEKQKLLEIFSVEERLRRVLLHIQRQINVVEAQQDIQNKVQKELGDRQREMVLREQLRAIQKELGEGDSSQGLEELQEKLQALELPEEARKEIDRDFDRLSRMSRESMEHQVLRTYLETVTELPWSQRSEEHLDLAQAAKVLAEDHYGLDDVKDRILEFLAVLKLQHEVAESDDANETETTDAVDTPTTRKGPILLFVGPPGVGKTSIARSIARALGREYVRMSLGGARDEADIRGHRRTYVGAMPGRIIQGMRQAGTRNPVVLLDEIDKLGASYQGNPASALLEVLDPAQNDTFVDHYLGVPFDLSEVLFVATANFIQNIPGPLLDRMEIVEFTGYTEAEKLEIAKRYLLNRQLEQNALTPEQLSVSDDALSHVITRYTRESGVRQLEQELGKLSRKVARRIVGGETAHVTLDESDITTLLGRPRVHPEHVAEHDQIGVATGMYYTPVGGDIMFVEATTMRGRGELVLTGQLGDVMKESARAAWSYARSRAPQLLIEDAQFDRDIHIHVPAGAIPKDGPSAGIVMATALVSTLSGVPVRRDIAMTGELTLTGRVLPIGGVKEKVLGAARAGMREIIIPRANEVDLEDLPKEIRDTLEIHLVDTLDEVLERVLRGGIFREDQVSVAG